jgi:tol-pal system protein YbgF
MSAAKGKSGFARGEWILLGAVTFLPLLGATGCTSVLAGADTSSAEVRELKQRVLELQRQVTVHQVEIERLRRRVAEMEGEPAPPPLPVPPPPRSFDQGTLPPPPPPARIEESDLEAVRIDTPPSPPVSPGLTAEEAAPPALPAPVNDPGAPVPAEGQRLYDEGYTLYHQGRYVDAENRFRRFLQEHGDTNLGDNAQFWIGAARFARGDRQGALSAFLETVDRYPEGNKVPDALFKAGQCLEALGDRERARYTYQEVAQRFPGTTAALNAEAALRAEP